MLKVSFQRLSVTTKIAGMILIILLASFLVHVLLILPSLRGNSVEQSKRLLLEKARGVAGGLNSVLVLAKEEAERIARLPVVESMDSRRVDEALHLLDLSSSNFLSFTLQDKDGIILSRPDKPERVGADRSGRNYSMEVMATGKTAFADVTLSEAGNLSTDIAVPVLSEEGAIKGLLVGSLGVDIRNVGLFQGITDVVVGKSGFACLVDRRGNLIARGRPENPGIKVLDDDMGFSPFIRQLEAGKEGYISHFIDHKRWIAAYSPVPVSGWGVIVQRPMSEIPNYAVSLLKYFISILAAMLVVGSLLSILLVRNLLAPLKVLSRGGEGTADGMERGNVRDEIVILSNRIGRMIEIIQGSEKELRKVNQDLEAEITQRRLAEEKLSFNLAVLDSQLQNSPDAVLVVNADDKIILHNQRFRDIWRIPDDLMEIGYDLPVLEYAVKLTADPDTYMRRVADLYKNRAERSHEEVELKDGRVLERYSEPMLGADGTYYGRVWYFRDITEKKQSEKAMRRSLLEKETLLKEIHHRVKNNLQAVSGILDLQSAHLVDARTVGILRESKNRIHTMAILHEKLCHSPDQNSVNLIEYISALTRYLVLSMGVSEGSIRFMEDIEDLNLNLDTAIPCGLIVTELVSNSIKHAFPERRKGEVRVRIGRAEGGFYRMVVTDNGVGIPSNLSLGGLRTLGLPLVSSLVEQLSGKMEVSSDQGTTTTVTFREYSEYQGAL